MEKPTITIEDVSKRFVYIRFRGSYVQFRKNSRSMFNRLFDYAKRHDLIDESFTKVLTIYNDNPYITNDENLRTSIAMTIKDDAKIIEEEDICESFITGKFAVAHFNINAKEYGEAWEYMYHFWAKESEYTLRDAIPFELYVEEPARNMSEKTKVDIYIPIE